MRSNGPKVLAVAARTKRIGYVFFDRGKLLDWGYAVISTKEDAIEKLQDLLKTYKPDCLVTENPETAFRKGGVQIPILEAFVKIGREASLLNIVLSRKKTTKNLYLEAAKLGEQYPDIAPWVPKKPPIWLPEHRNLVYFEALALARQALLGDPNHQG